MSKIALFFDQKVASFLVTLLALNHSQIYGYLVTNSSQKCSFFSQKHGQNRPKSPKTPPKFTPPFYKIYIEHYLFTFFTKTCTNLTVLFSIQRISKNRPKIAPNSPKNPFLSFFS